MKPKKSKIKGEKSVQQDAHYCGARLGYSDKKRHFWVGLGKSGKFYPHENGKIRYIGSVR